MDFGDDSLVPLLTASLTGVALALQMYILELEKEIEEKKKRPKRLARKFWTRKLFLQRPEQGPYNLLYKEAHEKDPDIFKSMARIDYDTFSEIVEGVKADAAKKNTLIRDTIDIETRVAITLRYLAFGDSFTSLSTVFHVSKSSISNIISSVCGAITNGELCKKYMQVPQTTEQWQKIAQDFDQQWNFPHCLGAVDGKHFPIQKPDLSIVLMAVCDANYRFIYIDDVGTNDGGTWEKSGLCRSIESSRLNIPSPTVIGDNNRKIPYCFVGGEAFPLKTYLMRPFPGQVLNCDSRKVFNCRVSRASRTIENSFGILSSQWRLFRRPINLRLDTSKKVIHAACILHNMLRDKNLPLPTNISKEDTNNGTTSETINFDSSLVSANFGSNNSGTDDEAKRIREKLCEYFMDEVAN